jgi:hypothetical protein
VSAVSLALLLAGVLLNAGAIAAQGRHQCGYFEFTAQHPSGGHALAFQPHIAGGVLMVSLVVWIWACRASRSVSPTPLSVGYVLNASQPGTCSRVPYGAEADRHRIPSPAYPGRAG